ncbi:MAG: TatD family hydrolase [Coriobacteriaceae bacterium]|jgi:TatD DNase family protein|nr:TatD family hydrolase [Coriobacteriaceae bacterium]
MTSQNHEEPLWQDALFRNKRKRGGYQVVAAPCLPPAALIADTHAHLDMLPDVPLVLARCALLRVGFICSIADPHEDADTAYDALDGWLSKAQDILPAIWENTRREAVKEGIDCPLRQDMPQPGIDTSAIAAVPHAFAAPAAAPVAPTGLVAPAAPLAPAVGTGAAVSAACAASFAPAVGIPRVRVAIGCHPHNAQHYDARMEAMLLERLRDHRTCALGEVGLDYHYDHSPRAVQREVFRRQVCLAHESGLPLILHMREAHEDGLAIMRDLGFPQAGVLLHCYNLDVGTLLPWLEHGCYVAFGGPLTFKKNDDTRKAALCVPQDRLLTETDAPFMTPEPVRGMACGPEHTVFTAHLLAALWENNQLVGSEGFLDDAPDGAMAKPLAATHPLGSAEFLESIYQNALGLLDREPTAWQRGDR